MNLSKVYVGNASIYLTNFSWIVDDYTDKMLKQIFGDKIPSVSELKKETSLMFVNSHYSLSGSRPLSPAVIEIGGIHIKEPKPIKQVNYKK